MEQCDIVSNEMKTFAHRLVFLHWSLVLLTTVSFHFEHRCLVRRKFYSNPGKGECTEVCDKTNYNVVYKAPIKSPQCPHSRQHNITAAMTGLTRELGSSTRIVLCLLHSAHTIHIETIQTVMCRYWWWVQLRSLGSSVLDPLHMTETRVSCGVGGWWVAVLF